MRWDCPGIRACLPAHGQTGPAVPVSPRCVQLSTSSRGAPPTAPHPLLDPIEPGSPEGSPEPVCAPGAHKPQHGMSSSVEEVCVSSGEGFFLEKLMILVIFFPAARLIEPFRSAKPLFLPFPGRGRALIATHTTSQHPPHTRMNAARCGAPDRRTACPRGCGAIPCSQGSLRAMGEQVSPVATLSESEVCFSCDSLCREGQGRCPFSSTPLLSPKQ